MFFKKKEREKTGWWFFWEKGEHAQSFKKPSSIVWLDTQKKSRCHDSKNNVEKPHDNLGGEANRLGDEINTICESMICICRGHRVICNLYACISSSITWIFLCLICLKGLDS